MRATKTADGITTTYYYYGSTLYGEARSGGTKLAYLHDEGGNIYGFQKISGNTTETYYYRLNLQGDVTGIYTENGTLIATYTYDPWGKVLSAIDLNASGIATLNPIRYRSYYYDTETGLYYLNSRYYDPETGRFVNGDSIIASENNSVQGFNLFAYCFNNPTNRTDSNGNWSKWATAGLIVGAALCIAAVTILTCGVGTATLAGAVAVGAAKGALIGATVGTIAGAGIGYAVTGTLEGALEGAAIGFGAGAVVGAVVGANLGANSWYNARAAEFTKLGSNEVILGRSGTYEQVAQSKGATYFHTTEARWTEVRNMFGVGEKGMWKINKTFLQQQIDAGRSFILTNNPLTDGGYYFAKEVAYLVSKGIGFTFL